MIPVSLDPSWYSNKEKTSVLYGITRYSPYEHQKSTPFIEQPYFFVKRKTLSFIMTWSISAIDSLSQKVRDLFTEDFILFLPNKNAPYVIRLIATFWSLNQRRALKLYAGNLYTGSQGLLREFIYFPAYFPFSQSQRLMSLSKHYNVEYNQNHQ